MPLNIVKKELEAEKRVGFRYIQTLARAETLVPGAGREAIDVLLCDATVALIHCDVQNDRVVLDGTLNCQAVYRMGDETSLRALSAKTSVSQAVEIPDAQPDMLCRSQATVESVEARYENGHMVFQAALGIRLWVMELMRFDAVTGLEDATSLCQKDGEICLVKLAAEAGETAVLTDRVELPRSLDARTSLMDWGSVQIDTAEPDLGGIRIKGKALVETLIASGIEGKPAVVVKYPIEFDKLVELPEWLAKEAQVNAAIRSLRTQVEQAQDDDDAMLTIQADVYFDIAANVRQCERILMDAYASSGLQIELDRKRLNACVRFNRSQTMETVRGTVLLEKDSPGVGSVIAARVLPIVSELRYENGRGKIDGLFDVTLLYMPVGSDKAASAKAVLEFSVDVPQPPEDESMIDIKVISAEASALMGDRVDMKIGLNVLCETRIQGEIEYIAGAVEGEAIQRRAGYVIYWPEKGEDAWTVAKRYAISEDAVATLGEVDAGKPLILRV